MEQITSESSSLFELEKQTLNAKEAEKLEHLLAKAKTQLNSELNAMLRNSAAWHKPILKFLHSLKAKKRLATIRRTYLKNRDFPKPSEQSLW